MDDFFLYGSLVIFGLLLFFGLPIAALISASRARRRVEKLENEAEKREKELRWLYDSFKALEDKVARFQAAPPVAPAPPPNPEPRPIATPVIADTADATTAPSKPVDPVDAIPPPIEDKTPLPPPLPPKPAEPQPAFEQRLAGWLTKIGAAVALLGVLYFFKYAIDSNLIGPTGRVLVGVIAGVAALGIAEKLRASTTAAFVQLLVGLGLAFLFVAMWAASVLYALIPVELGFAVNAIVLLIGAALAWHHRGQAILVLALVAVFLNPVLLSTGVDRPFALFSYLLAFTGVMMYVAVRLEFGIALAVAVLGVSALFTGWYDRFFDITDFRSSGIDRPPEELVGAYHELSSRLVPIVFVGLFAAEWLAAAFALKKSKWTIPLALASLLLMHAGWAALVPDRPLALGLAMVVAGTIGIVSLHKLERTDLLMVPMIAAFLILAARLPDVPIGDQTLVLGVLGVWTAVYVVAFLRTALEENQTIEPGAAIRGAVGLGVFTVLAAILLLDHHRVTAFTLIVAVVALAIVILGQRAALAGLGVAGVAIAFLMLLVGVEQRDRSGAPLDLPLLLSILAWSAVHVGGVVHAIHSGRALKWMELLTLSVATLGAVLLVFGATPDSLPTLRALITAGAGITDLAIAVWISRVRPDLKSWVSVLAAQALGLFALAMALALTGATITVVWALLALIAALIWAKDDSPAWVVLLVVLVFATLLRLFAIDVDETQRFVDLYRWTEGRQGLYRLTPFFNPRAFALVGTGLAFLGSARGLSKSDRPNRRPFAGAMAVIGHFLLIGFSVSELRNLTLELPMPPPMILDNLEFSAFWDTVEAAKSAQYSKLAMVTTLTLAGAAMVLLAIGFLVKDAFHRYLGLAVFVGTIAKLIGFDVWSLARTYQIVVLTVVGALLLGSGFLYARLRSLFTGKTAALLLALIMAGTVAREAYAVPLEVHPFASKRAITGVDKAGDYGVDVDLPLFGVSLAAGLLDDMRIAGPDGSAVPHLVREIVAESTWSSEEGRMYDPGVRNDGVFQALFELPPGTTFCRIDLSIQGPTPYLRRADVEAGESSETLRLVTTRAVVYAIGGDNGYVSGSSIRVPRSMARLVRISLSGERDSGDYNRISGARFIGCAPEGAPAPTEPLAVTIVSTQRDAEHHTTIVDLDVGADGVPLVALDLEIPTAEFIRKVDVAASAYKNAWPHVTSGYVSRVDDTRRPIDSTTLRLPELRKRWIRLTFDDRDDQPLTLTKVTGRVVRREIILRASSPGAHTLYVGDKAGSAAAYDLGQIYDRRSNEPPRMLAKMGAIEPNPGFGKPKLDPELPFTEQHRGPIGIGLGVVLLGLALYAVRLLRKS